MNTQPVSEVYNMDCMEYMKSVPDKFFELAIGIEKLYLWAIILEGMRNYG